MSAVRHTCMYCAAEWIGGKHYEPCPECASEDTVGHVNERDEEETE